MKECTTFKALLKPLTKNLIEATVKQYNSDNYYKKFKTRDHLIAMIYAQLHEIKSLRDLEVSFNSQRKLLSEIHCKKMSRSSLSDANFSRPAECFLWIAEQLMSLLPRKKRKDIKKIVRKIDSSPIQLKGKGYEWTLANRTLRCQGLKLHLEYDGQLDMPIRAQIRHANTDDCRMGQQWPIEANVIYVFDKGYYDYNWWWSINQKDAFFVTRLKTNAGIKIIKNLPVNNEKILEDTLIQFKNKSPRGGKKNLYVTPLRRVVVKREGKETPLVIVTNLLDIPAEIIAELYKERWRIELFFKWIKQNLRVKKFLGKSENAVKIQLAIALITYILIGIFKLASKIKLSLHQLLIWIKHNCNIKKRIYRAFKPPEYEFPIYEFALHTSGGKI
jgi:putative transposase